MAYSEQRFEIRMDPMGTVLRSATSMSNQSWYDIQVSAKWMAECGEEFHLPVERTKRSNSKQAICHTIYELLIGFMQPPPRAHPLKIEPSTRRSGALTRGARNMTRHRKSGEVSMSE